MHPAHPVNPSASPTPTWRSQPHPTITPRQENSSTQVTVSYPCHCPRRRRHPTPGPSLPLGPGGGGQASRDRRRSELCRQTAANGHHQHEVSEKRLAPGTFPYRIDMEICICGARRWVDQDGAPATPWRYVNLGTKPGGNEGAGVAPRTPPKSALEGLITCGSCGKPMLLDNTQGDQEAATRARAGVPRRGCTPAARRSCSSARCCKRS